MATVREIAKYTGLSISTVSLVLRKKQPYSEAAARKVAEAVAALDRALPAQPCAPTLRDVAEHAGVSVTTVSNVLNGFPVSPGNQERVQAALEALHYHPQPAERRKSPAMRVIVAIGGAEPDLYGGACAAAEEAGCEILMMNALVNSREDFYARIASDGAQGILFGNCIRQELIDELSRQLPLVQCGRYVDAPAGSVVSVDFQAAARRLTEAILDTGKRRIAFIRADARQHYYSRLYEAGYRQALQARGLPVREDLILAFLKDRYAQVIHYPDLRRQLEALMRREPDARPDAFLFVQEECACASLGILQDLGCRVPEDVAVAVAAGDSLLFLRKPYLTAPIQPLTDVGYAAMQTLLRHITSPQEPERQLLPCRIACRGSTHAALAPFGQQEL